MTDLRDIVESLPAPRSGSMPTEVREGGLRLIEGYLSGDRRYSVPFREALTTSDFQHLFGHTMGAALVAEYEQVNVETFQIVRESTVPGIGVDYPRVSVDGGAAPLPTVPEGGEYTERELADAKDSVSVRKVGGILSVTWEMIVNDDLNGLRNLPQRHARAARHTEGLEIVKQYVGSSGPKTGTGALYNSSNTISDPLTNAGLAKGLNKLMQQVDSDDQPIAVNAAYLVVPPALAMKARQLVNAVRFTLVEGGNEIEVDGNGLGVDLEVIVDPYMSQVASSNADTSWFLFADPDRGRAAIEYARLQGHEGVDLRLENATGTRPGGGSIDPLDGSFENDSIRYRVRHVLGAAPLVKTGGRKATVGSDGTGSN